jgi:hypothetical protein
MGILDIIFLFSALYGLVTSLLIAYKCKWSGLVFVTIPIIAGSIYVRAVIAVTALILSTNGTHVSVPQSYLMGMIIASIVYVPIMLIYSTNLVGSGYRRLHDKLIDTCANATFLTVSLQIALLALGLVTSFFWFLIFDTNVNSLTKQI